MKLLVVASNKGEHFAPFIEEQIAALQACGIEVLRYGITGKGVVGYLRELPSLRRMIRLQHPDIIHAHFGLSGLLANMQRMVPVVVTYHGCDINAKKTRPFSKVAMYLSAWNIFVSHRQMLNAFGSDELASRNHKWSIIPCGIDIHLFDDNHICTEWYDCRFPSNNYVLFAGSFDNFVKGPELAKQAVQIYNALHSESPIKLLELRGYTREQVVTLMYKCRALLLTSIREGSPQVVKAAMACACHIVSVDVGDVAERLSRVEGCYVVPNRDAKSLAAALEQAVAYGRTNGRKKLLDDKLDNAQVADTLISTYTKITNK